MNFFRDNLKRRLVGEIDQYDNLTISNDNPLRLNIEILNFKFTMHALRHDCGVCVEGHREKRGRAEKKYKSQKIKEH